MQIRLENFSGIIPKISARLLPESNATTATSTELYSGELRGLKEPTFIRSVGSSAKRAYTANVLDTTWKKNWVTFDKDTVDFYRGPNVNDDYQRHYWTGEGETPSVVEGQEIVDHTGDLTAATTYDWGIPNPTVTPTVAPPAYVANSDPVESRSYIFTYVNEWGEESAPSSPSDPKEGHANIGDWVVSGISTSYPIGTSWVALERVRIYRTITGTRTTQYRLVDDVAIVDLTGGGDEYDDSILSSRVNLNETLNPALVYYQPPPGTPGQGNASLDGLVELPNGFFAAFIDSDIYMSEPYQPHTWPRRYVMSVSERIIGLGVYHSGLIVCTESNPKVISGAHPGAMTMIELDQAEPCLSRRSIVSSTSGVFYASQNGVVLATEHGAQVITKPLISRTEWQNRYDPAAMQAAVNGQGYIARYTHSDGLIIGPEVGNGAMVDIGNLSYIETLQTNHHDGEVYVIRNGGLYQWNVSSADSIQYRWESKTFETPYPLNFGAFKIKWDIRESADSEIRTDEVTPYNEAVFAYEPLHSYNQFAYNNSSLNNSDEDPIDRIWKVDPDSMGVDEFFPDVVKMPWGGSDLIGPRANTLDDGVRVTIMARLKNHAEFKVVYPRVVTDEEQHHITSTFKADLWRVRMESSNNVYSFVMGEKGSELAKV